MYKALYRKWRPNTFDDLIGQPHITETLKRQLINERLSHAYLFVGTRGTGKTSSAKILAKAVNCEDLQAGNPCNLCPACVGIDAGSILDVEELDAASNNGVDHVRALRDEAVFTPTMLKKRVYIIDEVHMLSIAAFNALLKILEEPPAHLMFILATTEMHKVPATILSRCQRYAFRRVPASEITGRLKAVAGWETINLTDEAAALLAQLADGSMRDALALLDQCSGQETVDEAAVRAVVGLSGKEDILALLTAIVEQNTEKAISIVNELYYAGKGMETLLGELSTLMRDVLLLKLAAKGAENLQSGNFTQSALETFQNLSGEMLMQALAQVTATMSDLGRHANQKLAVELCFVRLCQPALSEDVSAVMARVAALEAMLENGTIGALSNTTTQEKREVIERESPKTVKVQEAVKPAEEAGFSDRDAPVEQLDDSPPWVEDTVPQRVEQNPPLVEEVLVSPPVQVTKVQQTETTVTTGTADIWAEVLEGIKGQIDIGIFMLISDKNEVKAQAEEQVFHIYAESEFTKIMLENKEVISAIEAEVSKKLEKPMRIQTHLGAPAGGGGISKLDALADKAKNLGILQ